MFELLSAQSMRVSLDSIRYGNGGLDAHRQSLLSQVPNPNNWAEFPYEHLKLKDLAYLTAKTGHEFAILRGKNKDILFHGDSQKCSFNNVLCDMLLSGRMHIYGHSHPGEETPTPSTQDRETLRMIKQHSSKLISGMTGQEITYTTDPFDGINF